MKRRALIVGLSSVSAAALSEVLRPRQRISTKLPAIELDKQVPADFGDWSIDKSLVPILPNAEVQARLDVLYTQVLARTYINRISQRVMLSIAYGQDQGSDATAAHRPEFCYTAQGFLVKDLGEKVVQLNGHNIRVKNLYGRMSNRHEPITYWVTLNDTAVLPGLDRKLTQMRLGLQGYIPDGMLVRVSSLGENLPREFEIQHVFLTAFEQSLPEALRARYFGKGSA